MFLKHFGFTLCLLLIIITSFCQQNPQKEEIDNSKFGITNKIISINYNSDEFIRVFDGIQLSLKDTFSGMNNFSINGIKRTNDTSLLQSLGIKDFTKPYMFLSSGQNDFRDFIYSKVDIDEQLKELNLPLIINGNLIQLNDYDKLNNIDKNSITKIKFDKTVHLKPFILPMGAILINTK